VLKDFSALKNPTASAGFERTDVLVMLLIFFLRFKVAQFISPGLSCKHVMIFLVVCSTVTFNVVLCQLG
jgi:hypothetical protein